jgi:hypothetical protein
MDTDTTTRPDDRSRDARREEVSYASLQGASEAATEGELEAWEPDYGTFDAIDDQDLFGRPYDKPQDDEDDIAEEPNSYLRELADRYRQMFPERYRQLVPQTTELNDEKVVGLAILILCGLMGLFFSSGTVYFIKNALTRTSAKTSA